MNCVGPCSTRSMSLKAPVVPSPISRSKMFFLFSLTSGGCPHEPHGCLRSLHSFTGIFRDHNPDLGCRSAVQREPDERHEVVTRAYRGLPTHQKRSKTITPAIHQVNNITTKSGIFTLESLPTYEETSMDEAIGIKTTSLFRPNLQSYNSTYTERIDSVRPFVPISDRLHTSL